MNSPSGMGDEPCFRVFRGVTGAVVEHDVNVECRIDRGLDLVQEPTKVHGIVLAGDRCSGDLPGVNVKRSEQRCCPVADVFPFVSTNPARFRDLVWVFSFPLPG